MRFDEALQAMRQGKKVYRRKRHQSTKTGEIYTSLYLDTVHNCILDTMTTERRKLEGIKSLLPYHFNHADIVADDWQLKESE